MFTGISRIGKTCILDIFNKCDVYFKAIDD